MSRENRLCVLGLLLRWGVLRGVRWGLPRCGEPRRVARGSCGVPVRCGVAQGAPGKPPELARALEAPCGVDCRDTAGGDSVARRGLLPAFEPELGCSFRSALGHVGLLSAAEHLT